MQLPAYFNKARRSNSFSRMKAEPPAGAKADEDGLCQR
jgi:hypothetical protein